jgi:hypothetical protein
MDVEIGELERIDYGQEDVEAWHVELVIKGGTHQERGKEQRRLEGIAEARLQVVLAEGAEEFDSGERSVFFTIAPRTLDLKRELEEFIAALAAPSPPEPDYPISSPFHLFGAQKAEPGAGLDI